MSERKHTNVIEESKEIKEIRELIDNFVAYRNVLVPLQESLRSVGETYEAIRTDLDNLTKSFSGNAVNQLDKIHSTLNQQAKSGQELSRRIEEYSASGEKYSRAVTDMTDKFKDVADKINVANSLEKDAENMLAKLDAIIAEKRASYNLKELQKSLDVYNKNVERVSDFINKDIAAVLQQNAEKIESIRKENEQLAALVAKQGKTVDALVGTFAETSSLLKKTVEKSGVNEMYLYEALDKWAAERKVKIKKK